MQVVTPSAPWTNQESQNVKGHPATHAVDDGKDKTLCGKSCTGWMWQNWNGQAGQEMINCKSCLHIMKKRQE